MPVVKSRSTVECFFRKREDILFDSAQGLGKIWIPERAGFEGWIFKNVPECAPFDFISDFIADGSLGAGDQQSQTGCV